MDPPHTRGSRPPHGRTDATLPLPPEEADARTVDVAVVGAGLAGLAAARRLRLDGLGVVLFDKARGPGGRTSLRRAEPFAFDHGAQYFTVRDEGFERSVRTWQRRGIVAPWSPRLAVLGGERRDAEQVQRTQGSLPGGSAGAVERFVGVPGMNAMAKDLAEGLDVRLGTRVGRCEPNARGWRLFDAEGARLVDARQVLLTTPPAQALPLLAHAPELAHVVEGTHMEPSLAVLLGFDAPVDAPFDAAFVNAGPLTWIARDSSKPGRPPQEAWVLHAHPAWAADHFDRAPEASIGALRAELARAVAGELPPVRTAQLHRWRHARPRSARAEVALYDPARSIGLAGDWLSGGRCEGAFLSGAEAAARILHALPRGTAKEEA